MGLRLKLQSPQNIYSFLSCITVITTILHTVVKMKNIIQNIIGNDRNAGFQGVNEEQQVCTVFQFVECS